MNATATIKDKTGSIGIVTNTNIVQKIAQISGAFAQNKTQLLPYGYEVLTSLTKEQLVFLLQLISNLSDIPSAIQAKRIVCSHITRDDIHNLNLEEKLRNLFTNLIILNTSQDDGYLPEQKTLLPFFSTLFDANQQFENPLVLTVSTIDQPSLKQLMDIVRDIPFPTQKLLYQELTAVIDFIKTKTSLLTPTQLLTLLQAANFLGAQTYILAGLYDSYKNNFSTTAAWQVQENAHQFLVNIRNQINLEYPPSIELLLLKKEKDFYSFEMVQPKEGRPYKKAKIFGDKILSLQGIHLIPEILDCASIQIQNTSIKEIKTNDFNNLPHVQELSFIGNKNLSHLESNCFHSPQLYWITFLDNNLSELPANVFNLLSLTELYFKDNHMHTIKANWARNLASLRTLILDESELITFEPGWTNGFLELKTIALSKNLNPVIQQILIGQLKNLTFLKVNFV